jgi:stage II sporulation SpoE-like protein/GAF domain-containing protein
MTDPVLSLEQRMLEAERRAREEAERVRAEAESAREEAERAREEAELARGEAELARLQEAEARARLQVLVEAGAAMAASLEVRTVLSAATGAAARRICDYAIAFLSSANGGFQSAVGAHRDPARFGTVERMANAALPDPDNPHSLAALVLRTGEPVMVQRVSRERMERMMAPGEQLELARSLGFASVIVVPLAARGRTLGALALVRDGASPPFQEVDLTLAGMLAARAGLAVDNARLYEEREYVAVTLQRSLLPPELPQIPGLDIGARYLPASEGTQVGGDFYDVFDTDGDHWMAVIGDVVGKGAAAAAMMGLARYTIRTAAMSESRPSHILQTLNQAVLRQTSDQRFCTACCLRILCTGYDARVTLSSGGHPLPLIVHEDGRTEVAGSPGTIIGVFDDPVLSDQVVDISTGDALVLYTDGVTDERKGDDEFGEARLHRVLSELAGASAQAMADGVVDAVVDFRTGSPRDDIALLVLKVAP